MKKKGKWLKIFLLCIALFLVLFISFFVYKRISILGVDRGACSKNATEIKFNEFCVGNTKPEEMSYYMTGQIKEWDEIKQCYVYKGGKKSGVREIKYCNTKLLGVPVKAMWYYFDEETQKCQLVSYCIETKYKDKLLKAVKKKFGDSYKLENLRIERDDYIFSAYKIYDDRILVNTEFK